MSKVKKIKESQSQTQSKQQTSKTQTTIQQVAVGQEAPDFTCNPWMVKK